MAKTPPQSQQWLVFILALIKFITADSLIAAAQPMTYIDENYTELFPAMEISSGFHVLTANSTEENLRTPFVEPIYPIDLKRDYSLRRIARLSNEITGLKTKLRQIRRSPCKWDVHVEDCYPPNCREAMKNNDKTGIYKIKPPGTVEPFVYARCEKYDASRFKNATNSFKNLARNGKNENDPWLTIQYRGSAAVSFQRDWASYKKGFGNLEGDFFYGLEKIHKITQSELHELWIELRNYDCEFQWARYASFLVANEENNYALMGLGDYSGNAGDSFSYHGGQMWSTAERDNDQDRRRNCALIYKGGWWFQNCYRGHLNGMYKVAGIAKSEPYEGIIWENISKYSLQSSKMSIRPIY